jgi:hypothetical protein
MYSNRIIGGKPERFCNVFGWYVKPDYRHYSVSLLSFLVRRPGLTFFNVTPADHVLPIFKRMGFSLADESRYVCRPGVGTLLGSRSKVRVVREEDVNENCSAVYNSGSSKTTLVILFADLCSPRRTKFV